MFWMHICSGAPETPGDATTSHILLLDYFYLLLLKYYILLLLLDNPPNLGDTHLEHTGKRGVKDSSLYNKYIKNVSNKSPRKSPIIRLEIP